ncbi:predicted protein [Uncinocarpus reesii 1704]|uniref:Uncharacterized protein n=1 Tax=Uncinocarpus reesii (strain UAMH 1704) TaxID=336963 RepID=C4JGG3_UNCRE|nr:uncharacterized protein UREG_01154 [Uncinocarpus reesii 1704]EEP76305.1 predicted protein [Uncinocarpus reesii 1704]
MPSNHSVSPVKRSVSFPQAPSDHSSTSQHSPSTPAAHPQPHKPTAHKPHRPHVVGTHRVHGRTHSHKNLNKLQRLALAHNLAADGVPGPPTAPRHQRKKSAPASPSTSPRTGQNHVRWNQSIISLPGPPSNGPVRKNLSTPVLKRNGSGILVKKNLAVNVADKAESSDIKKSVGFELADSGDEDEWEDHSSISASSTRRNSVVSGKMNGQNSLTGSASVTKSPLTQESRTADVNDKNGLHRDEPFQDDHTSGKDPRVASLRSHASDQHLVASRILQQPHSSKIPPSISSISATATPVPPNRTPRSSSFANLASSLSAISHSPAPSAPTSMISSNPHAASSSAEGGVSRFLINNSGPRIEPRSESDPATPSSFLPHYHPRTPPSPESTLRRSKSPKPSANGPLEPHSRTQQKLWLQRTATMSNSPPDTSISGLPPTSAVDSSYAGPQSRPGTSGYAQDSRRFAMGAGPGLLAHQQIVNAGAFEKYTIGLAQSILSFTDSETQLSTVLSDSARYPGSNAGGKLTRANSMRDLANGHGPSRPFISG